MWDENVVLAHFRFESHRLHLRDDVVARPRLGWRSRDVRLGRKNLGMRPGARRIGSSDRLRFDGTFGSRVGWGIAWRH